MFPEPERDPAWHPIPLITCRNFLYVSWSQPQHFYSMVKEISECSLRHLKSSAMLGSGLGSQKQNQNKTKNKQTYVYSK